MDGLRDGTSRYGAVTARGRAVTGKTRNRNARRRSIPGSAAGEKGVQPGGAAPAAEDSAGEYRGAMELRFGTRQVGTFSAAP